MGIKGLTRYISEHSEQYFKPFHLHDTYLVIDGNCITCCLYSHYAECNCVFGGDYDKFSKCVDEFFDELLKCKVTPLVIFDGGLEKKKIKTAISRRRQRVLHAATFTPQSQLEKKLFPLCFSYVFIDVLNKKGIKYVVTMFEADSAIAAVAKSLHCPVLSFDSDYYIFGSSYISFTTLERGIIKLENGTGYAKCCKIYEVENLLCNFKEQDTLLLPLFAMLLGNDYVKRSTFKNFFAHLKLGGTKRTNNEQRRIVAVLNWIRKCTFDYALTSILSRIPKTDRQRIVNITEMAINGYLKLPTHLLVPLNIPKEHYHKSLSVIKDFKYKGDINNLEYIDETSYIEEFDTSDESDNDNYYDADDTAIPPLPDWFIQEHTSGKLPRYLMDIITHKLYLPYTQIEDFTYPTTVLACEEILNVLFGLLIPCRQRQNCYIRCMIRGNNTKLIHHQLRFKNNKSGFKLPSLYNLRIIPLHERREILNNTLKINADFVNDIPPHWQLYMASIIFWIKQQESLSSIICHIYSLLFCMLYHIIDNKIGYYRTMRNFDKRYMKIVADMKNKANCPVENTTDATIIEACKCINKDDCLLSASFFISNFKGDGKLFTKQTKFVALIVHFFAQFQNCLKHTLDLNALLGCPYEQPVIGNLYNGTFLYNLVVNFKRRKDIDAYIITVLQQSPSLLRLFNALLFKVKSTSADNGGWITIKKKRERKQ